MRTYKGIIDTLPNNGIFVFGSNTQGRHGKGAALIARLKFGAVYGQARGLQGKSYAIVTKDLTKTKHPSVPPFQIWLEIYKLYEFARENPQLDFYIAYKGTGVNLNSYTAQEMANIFSWSKAISIPNNIIFEEEFSKLINK